MRGYERFQRYADVGDGSLAPIFRDLGPVVYVLEFADGQFYVGQTVSMVQRYSTHRRTWPDVTAVQVREVPQAELHRVELATIRRHRSAGKTLRNKAHNHGHDQPAPLDDMVSVIDQRHWVLGHASDQTKSFARGARRPPGPTPKMFSSRIGRSPAYGYPTTADAVLADIAAVLSQGIPDAVNLEQTYWTITDYPATAQGRMATLSAGPIEVLYVPRQLHRGELDDGTAIEFMVSHLNVSPNSAIPDTLPGLLHIERSLRHYKSTPVDQLMVLTGCIGDVLEHEVVRAALREFAVSLMRAGRPAKWARFHSMEVARRAYEVVDLVSK